MLANYNAWLVVLSIFVALLASYTALDLASHLSRLSGWFRRYWVFGGALSLGVGIWSMHFVGMLAYHSPVPLAYDIATTFASFVLAIVTSGIALFVVRQGTTSPQRLAIGASVMGAGISAMHYTGMAAIRMMPPIQYDPVLVGISILIAVTASAGGLWLASNQGTVARSIGRQWQKIGSSIVMGAAIAGMHYMGMAATIIDPNGVCLSGALGIDSNILAVVVTLGAIMVLLFTMVIVTVDARLTEQKKIQDEHRLAARVFNSVAEGVVITAADKTILSVNPAFSEITGYTREETVGKTPKLFASGLHAPAFYKQLWDSLISTGHWKGEIRDRRKSGEIFTTWASISSVRNELGSVSHYVSIFSDISARKSAEESLHLLDLAIQASTNGIALTKPGGTEDNSIIFANPAFERMTGYAEPDVIGRNLRMLVGDDQDQPGYERLREAVRMGQKAEALLRNYRKDGTMFWNEVSMAPVHDEDGRLTHFVNVFNDVTERVRYAAELEHQANHDSLTGLANRNLLNDRLDQAIVRAERHGQTLTVLFIDLDHFKNVNDSLGHAVGDELIKAVGERLAACVRDVDTVARPGGDEFVLILTETESENDVMVAVTRVLEAISGLYLVAQHELHIGCSIGACLYPRDGRDAGTLLKNADAAMYRAKEGGRNRFQFYQEEMNARLSQRLSLEAKLRHALERNELLLHYQPQIDLRSGMIVGAEALIRWQHPELGLVSPDQFIPIAEETGMIVPIGEWVLRTACAQTKAWQDQGLPRIRVAVNISARQFRHKGLLDMIQQALQSAHLAPEFLEIEITESMVMHDPEETIALLQKFKAVGLQIALDDFGTGFSSLSYLKRFPLDVLKIDQSFVRGIVTSRHDAAIVKTVIGLARNLDLRTIAEGVETAEQTELLQAWTSDEVQGFHFSRPLADAAFISLLKEDKKFNIPGMHI